METSLASEGDEAVALPAPAGLNEVQTSKKERRP